MSFLDDDSATDGSDAVDHATDDTEMKYCRDCGNEIKAEAEICPECGIRQQPPGGQAAVGQKSPGLAAVCSFFVVGLGQMYNGQIGKGLLLLIVVPFLTVVIMSSISGIGGLLFGAFLWLLNIADAYSQAEKINAGDDPEF